MKSPLTGKDMVLKVRTQKMTFKGEDFDIEYQYFRDEESDADFTDDKLDKKNLDQVYDLYRAKHKIPFVEKIKAIREKYGVSAKLMSGILGIGTNGYGDYEKGSMPRVSLARSISSIENPYTFKNMIMLSQEFDGNEEKRQELIKKVEGIIRKEHDHKFFNELEEWILESHNVDEYTGFIEPDLNKFENMVIYFCEKIKPYKTKMNKLLYYADFLNYRNNGRSITGMKYRAIQLGPVPLSYEAIYESMERDRLVSLERSAFEHGERVKFEKCLKPFDSSLFAAWEIKSMDEVCQKFNNVNGSKIILLSHDERGWKECEKERTLISYRTGLDLIHV